MYLSLQVLCEFPDGLWAMFYGGLRLGSRENESERKGLGGTVVGEDKVCDGSSSTYPSLTHIH